jgi:maltooligosyltrehalose trehalohydrolase
MLCAPNIPLLFMGEEYGELAPFLYFTSHTDPGLIQAVREGRRQEFAKFSWGRETPDPQDPRSFQRSLLQHQLRAHEPHRGLLRFYRDVIALRKRSPALNNCDKRNLELTTLPEHNVLLIRRWDPRNEALLLFASLASAPVALAPPIPSGRWRLDLCSEAVQYGGSGQENFPAVLQADDWQSLTLPPFAFVLYRRVSE